MSGSTISRRHLLAGVGAMAANSLVAASKAAGAPAAPVAVARCRSYDASELIPALEGLFDKLGGLGRLVKGKTVAIKLNFNPGPTVRLGHLPLGDTHWTNPQLVCATMSLMAKAGVHRIRLVEQSPAPVTHPLEETFLEANWDPQDFISAAPRVEFENTDFPGSGRKFVTITVPGGGLLFPAYRVNHSYVDCDVFVSIAKCKDHPTTGVTNVMKNLFGMLPPALYGALAGKFADNDLPANGRWIVHLGARQPYDAPAEIDPSSPRHDGYRVPRAVADLNAARPVHLAIVDGVTTMAGAQTPDLLCTPVAPGWLVAGTNAVNTSAVGIAAMSYAPAADRGAAPFTTCDNKLLLAEQLGVGTCDLKRIEIRGTPVAEVAFDFMKLRLERAERIRRGERL